MRIDELRKVVEREYSRLCEVLKLDPIPLDVYLVDEDSKQFSELGISLKSPLAFYDKEKIILPRTDNELNALQNYEPKFPPIVWDKAHPKEWPLWRVELWHEVCHQVENDIIRGWKGGVEGGDAWKDAVIYIAKCFKVTKEQVTAIL